MKTKPKQSTATKPKTTDTVNPNPKNPGKPVK